MPIRLIPFPGIKLLQCRRHYQNPLINPDLDKVPDLSNRHWASEALVPTFLNPRGVVKSFRHATNPIERSPLGDRFLKKKPSAALSHAANSIVHVHRQLRGRQSRQTAFAVGPGGSISIQTSLISSFPNM